MSSAGIALVPIYNEALGFPNMSGLCLGESILVYLSVGNSMIPMSVLESDSIESVKLRIQSYKGFVVRNQKLVSGGRELSRSNSLLRDYGVADGNILHLVLRLSDLQLIKVRTVCGKEFTFNVERGRDVKYVKQKIATRGKEFVNLEEQEVVCNGESLEDQRLIDDICRNDDAVVHLLVRKTAKLRAKPVEKSFELSVVAAAPPPPPTKPSEPLEPVIVNPKIKLSLAVKEMMSATLGGLSGGNKPVRSMEGTGGAYFMADPTGQKYVSVFKPMDEEPMAANNPRGLPVSADGEGLKKGTRVGEGALREVAAYLLDYPKVGDDEGFAGVPPTFLVKCFDKVFNHSGEPAPKLGSLQKFVENNGSCEDMGPGAFPVKEVHKVSVLDIRLANADRHAGNILRGKGEDGNPVLIPIDHGYCLPETFEECTFDWLYWPQARKPYSGEIVDYVRSLDAEADIELLKFHGWELPLECARTLRISTMLLKKGVERGLTAFAIGNMMCRETLRKESVIEEIVQEAQDSVLPGTSEPLFLEAVSLVMDRRLNELAP